MIKAPFSWHFCLILAGCAGIMTVYIPNNGGTGLMLPYNSLLLLLIGGLLLSGLFAFRYPARENPVLKWYAVGCLLLSLPLLWSPVNWMQSGALNHVMTLWAAFLGYVLLSRMDFSSQTRQRCLQLILILAVIQAVLGGVQSFFPGPAHAWLEYDWLRNGGRPYGIFQQYNLLGSFLATGAGCGAWLYLDTPRGRYRGLYLTGVLICVFMLQIGQSRTGINGAVFIICLLVLVMKGDQHKNKLWLVTSFITVFVLCKIREEHVQYLVFNNVNSIASNEYKSFIRDHIGSNTERALILKNSLGMILARPLTGWGYGSFEHMFSRFAQGYHPFPGMATVAHPHNEVLFAWIEGGVTAVAGLLALLTGWLKQVCRLRGNALGASLLPLPLLCHVLLEYPFYQSLLHLALFVLLLRLAWVDNRAAEGGRIKPPGIIVSVFTAAFCLGLGASALVGGIRLTEYERTQFAGMPAEQAWYLKTQGSRAEFDHLMGLLMRYNSSRDPALLSEFILGAEPYLSIHNDTNILRYEKLINKTYRNDDYLKY